MVRQQLAPSGPLVALPATLARPWPRTSMSVLSPVSTPLPPLRCFNQCRGRGKCVESVCICDPGFWGLDCSATLSPNGSFALLLGGGGKQGRDGGPELAPAPSRPSFWIYDLPVRLTAWQYGLSGLLQDFGRVDGPATLEAMLRSTHRSATPEGVRPPPGCFPNAPLAWNSLFVVEIPAFSS